MRKTINKKAVVKIPISLFKDRNRIWIAYSKKYDISAYGHTKDRAIRMFSLQVLEILNYTNPKEHYKRFTGKDGKFKR